MLAEAAVLPWGNRPTWEVFAPADVRVHQDVRQPLPIVPWWRVFEKALLHVGPNKPRAMPFSSVNCISGPLMCGKLQLGQ
jgi:hypothetical protein